LEKLLSLSKQGKSMSPKIKLDFSASREGSNIDEYLKIIENACDKEYCIQFEYSNSYGEKALRLVEPLGAIYKWYAWYMLGYCQEKKDYRLFKIVRMRNLKKLEQQFSKKHENIDKLLEQQEKKDNRKYIDVKLLCKEVVLVSIEEYFPKGSIEALEDGTFLLQFTVPENEIGWKGILLTYGDKIKIMEPEALKREFIAKAKEILKTYK
jgi:predicted DNA-binding transcriptional regulator YafY